MAQAPKIHLPKISLTLPSKRIMAIVGGGLIALLVLWYIVLSVSFSADDIREQTLQAMSEIIGTKVTAIPQQEFSLFPMPVLILHSLQVQNHPKSQHPSMISAPVVEVRPSIASIFSGDLIVSVALFEPNLEFESFADNAHSWQAVESEEGIDDAAQSEANSSAALIQNLSIVQGNLHYAFPQMVREYRFSELDLNFNFASSKAFAAEGWFKLARDYFYLDAVLNEDTVKANISNGSSELALSGAYDAQTQAYKGTQKFSSRDLGQLLSIFMVSGKETPTEAATDQAYPLEVSSEFLLKANRLTASDVVIYGRDISGKGEILALLKDTPEINAIFEMEKLSLMTLFDRGIFKEFIEDTAQHTTINGHRIELPEDKASSLPRGVKMNLSLKSKTAKIGDFDTKQLQLAATLDDATIDLAQLSGKLPQDGQFLLKGRVEGSYDGLAFKGTADIAGSKLAELFTLNEITGEAEGDTLLAIPENMQRYRGRANMFYNPAVLRLSEGVMRIEKTQLLGTLVRQKIKKLATPLGTSKPKKQVEKTNVEVAKVPHRYEGAFRISNINLDEWIGQEVSVSDSAIKADNISETKPHDYAFDWMRRLMKKSGDSSYNFKLNFEEATFMAETQEPASFRMAVDRQKVLFDEIDGTYNKSAIKGNLLFKLPEGKKPNINGALSMDLLDVDEFFGFGSGSEANMFMDENGAWSRKEFDILWLDDITGNVVFNADNLVYRDYQLSSFSSNILVENGYLQLRDLATRIWDGQLKAQAKLSIGKLPTFTGLFTLNSFNFRKLHPVYDLFDDLSGGGSIRAELSTTGVNPASAIQNMQGTVSFAGSGVEINGFNLANMVRAANAVRTIDDIDKLIEFANRGGETKINTIQGAMNIDSGFLRTPGMQISTAMGSGNIKGQLNLLNWQTNVAITLYLSALQQKDPPNIRLVFVGPLDQVGRSLDTQSLESFIAKRAAERLLVSP